MVSRGQPTVSSKKDYNVHMCVCMWHIGFAKPLFAKALCHKHTHRAHFSLFSNRYSGCFTSEAPSKGPSEAPNEGSSEGPSKAPTEGPSKAFSEDPSKAHSGASNKGPKKALVKPLAKFLFHITCTHSSIFPTDTGGASLTKVSVKPLR